NKKKILFDWLNNQLFQWFDKRIIHIDSEIMLKWSKICADHKQTLPIIDSLIAATAISQKMILITRNTRDFNGIGDVILLNPWLDN
ncbi:MAG: PIN domain-containing protein, partial [Endomicrobium sp.]|nr:PIN domain-containing protein [Endomicrobium sp.]